MQYQYRVCTLMFYTAFAYFSLLYNVLRKLEAITKKKISSGGNQTLCLSINDSLSIDPRSAGLRQSLSWGVYGLCYTLFTALRQNTICYLELDLHVYLKQVLLSIFLYLSCTKLITREWSDVQSRCHPPFYPPLTANHSRVSVTISLGCHPWPFDVLFCFSFVFFLILGIRYYFLSRMVLDTFSIE